MSMRCTAPGGANQRRRQWATLLIGLTLALVGSGCGIGPDTSDYGSVMYPTKNSSLNGLGVFEKMCKQAGSRCIIANRLSSRLENVDAIVLVGDTLHPPAKEARDWLEEWLAGEPGRTVVYFGRDFDAEIYYRQRTLDQMPAGSKQQATIDLAAAQTRLDTLLLKQMPDDVFCRWFTIRIHGSQRAVQEFRGPWADAVAEESAAWPVRVVLQPPDPAQAANKPKWPAAPTTTTTPFPQPPVTSQPTQQDGPVVFTSVWVQWDIGDDETWDSEWDKAPEPEVLLSGADGTPLVTRLTSESYPDSHILSIVNGAPLLNGTLVEPHFRRIARKIIDDLQPAERIALLPFDEHGILVSLLQEEENEIAGLSVLTTWPMNIIVAHLAFLGILICLALFPILGRPQKLRQRHLADFGQHAESLGEMLQRTGDLSFALRAVADYHRTVRVEAVPGWVESALEQSNSASPPGPDATVHSAAATPSDSTAQPPSGEAAGAPASSASDQNVTASRAQPHPETDPHPDSSA